MGLPRLPKFRFRLSSVLILMLGIAIGYTLNTRTLRTLLEPGSEAMMRSLPSYVVEPPDVLSIEIASNANGPTTLLRGEYRVLPDGTINLGAYGSVYVTGMTIDAVRVAVAAAIGGATQVSQVAVDVSEFNSKRYYIITKDPSAGDSILEMPVTANETVLNALARIGGVTTNPKTDIWISRPSSNGKRDSTKLPVDYAEIRNGDTTTNYQLLPGDRLFLSKRQSRRR